MKTSKASKTFLTKFTSSKDFPAFYSTIVSWLGDKITRECSQREDSLADTGMIGLAVHCREKSQRIFNKLAGKRKSTEKFEDELWDNLAFALYLVIYWEMIKEQEKHGKC